MTYGRLTLEQRLVPEGAGRGRAAPRVRPSVLVEIMHVDSHDEHVKSVYAHFGLAVYLAQVLEHGLANALVFLDLLPNRADNPVPRKQWEAEFDSFLERNFETTLGKMIRSLKAVTPIPSDLEAVLTDALTKRNFLAHHFFRERSDAFVSHEGRERMIEELQNAQALFDGADTKLSEATKSAREKYGFTDERAEQFLKQHLSKIKHDL